MRLATYRNDPEGWIEQIFNARAARTGGVVRRSVSWIEREIGRARFENAVLERGFHMIECGGQLVVICNGGSVKVIC